jgi:hypothetical protein
VAGVAATVEARDADKEEGRARPSIAVVAAVEGGEADAAAAVSKGRGAGRDGRDHREEGRPTQCQQMLMGGVAATATMLRKRTRSGCGR